MPIDFTSMLNWWQWAILGSVPLLIVALYFLKLRREPVAVPSTYLWKRAIEDLHVNSLWQRLRRNLLLFLQLLLVALLILACLRPSWQGTSLSGERFIFLLDTSASMSATDVEPTRLEAAKKQIDDLVRTQLDSGDAAMIVSFSDRARVEQPFTTNHELLRRRLQSIQPTQNSSDITEALRVAAGLANPSRTASDPGDVQAAQALAATVFILTDGALRVVPDFSWGNLQPKYVPIGEPDVENVAVTALGVSRHPSRPEELQTIVQVHDFSPTSSDDREVTVSLYLDNDEGSRLLDAADVSLPQGGGAGAEFTLGMVESGSLRVEIDQADALALDNRAFAALNPSPKCQVLLVTAGNDLLQRALTTDDSQRVSELTVAAPDHLQSDTYKKQATDGTYDLIIFDQCSPAEMPRANTLFIGSKPPAAEWILGPEQTRIQLIDIDVTHPLMKYLDFGDVQLIGYGQPVDGPSGKKVLLDSDIGPMCVIAPRDGFEDVVLGFGIIRRNEQGEQLVNTDWPRRLSFPLFVKNTLEYLGGGGQLETLINVQPGQVVPLRSSFPVPEITVETPGGEKIVVPRSRDNVYSFSHTNQTGIYRVYEASGQPATQRFAVNSFDTNESDLAPRKTIDTSWSSVPATATWEPTRHEAWRWLIGIALAVAVGEWYIYNRRVYL